MVSVDVKDLTGASKGTVELPETWFAGKVNIPVMHLVVTAQLAAARQGTHKTKTRAEVSGGGRKPFRQKGTGRARAGSTRGPIWIGGGHANARVPSDHSIRVNKKVKRAALISALTDRASNELITVVRDLKLAEPKTKQAVAALSALGLEGKVLLVLADRDAATERSFANIPNVHLLIVDQLNTHDILNSDVMVIDEAVIDLIGTGRRAGSPSNTEDAA